MTIRSEANAASAQGNNLEFFVHTGSVEPPIVCLADNNGFPTVHDIYARQFVYQSLSGVHVSVRFDAPANEGTALAVNIYQPNMPGPFTVVPLA